MRSGTDLNPTAPSTRMISCLWSFFTLILVSSYTANLGRPSRFNESISSKSILCCRSRFPHRSTYANANRKCRRFSSTNENRLWCSTWRFDGAFLSSECRSSSERTHNELVHRLGIDYADLRTHVELHLYESCVCNGGIEYGWNQTSLRGKLRLSDRVISLNSLLDPTRHLIDSLRSTTSDYNIMRNCELTSIGSHLDSKGYGFGVPQSNVQLTMFDRCDRSIRFGRFALS